MPEKSKKFWDSLNLSKIPKVDNPEYYWSIFLEGEGIPVLSKSLENKFEEILNQNDKGIQFILEPNKDDPSIYQVWINYKIYTTRPDKETRTFANRVICGYVFAAFEHLRSLTR